MTILELCIKLMGVISIAFLLLDWLLIRREIWQARRETSRFPLFESRDKLVWLIAEKKVSEDNPAWQDLYRGVNVLLNLRYRWQLWDVIKVQVTHLNRLKKDPVYRSTWEQRQRQQEIMFQQHPELKELDGEIQDRFRQMVLQRTDHVHRLRLLVFFILVWFIFQGVITVAAAWKFLTSKSNEPVDWRGVNKIAQRDGFAT